MKKTIRLLSVLLSALMIILAFASCAEKGEGDTTTAAGGTQGQGSDVTAEVTTERLDDFGRPWVEDELPETLDMGGRDFTVHTRGNVERYEWLATEENGEMLNDAIYHRNLAVEERYKVKINVIAEGSWSDYGTKSLPKITSSIKTNDGFYDLLAGYGSVTSLATSGLLYDLTKLDRIKLEKPWWSQNFNEEVSVKGANYFAVGAMSLSMVYSMENIFVNTDILADSAGPSYSIYKTVKDHGWTFEELETRAKEAWQDKNANGIADNGDIVGLASGDPGGNTALGFLYCTGITLTFHDAEGALTTEGFDVDKGDVIMDEVIKLLYESEGCVPNDQAKVEFSDGTSLFCFHWLYCGQTKYAKNMDHYGVIPMPLLNKDQPDYVTPVQAGMHIYCIPIDVKDVEQNSIVTEALAAESYRTLLPSYYEIVLKTRYAKDAETSQMIDIIYNTASFDFAYIFRSDTDYSTQFKNMITSKTNTLSSTYKAIKRTADASFTRLNESLAPKN